MRDVSCYEMTTSTLVDDALCTDVKANDFEPCNEVPFNVIRPSFGLLIKYYARIDQEPCLEWTEMPWSACSVTCGPGIKRREVACPEPDMCNPDTRPSETASCNETPCVDWVTGGTLRDLHGTLDLTLLSNRSVERVQRFVRRRTSLPGGPVHGSTYVRTGRRMSSDAETGAETALCHRALHATQQSPRAQRGQRYGCAHPLYRSVAVTQVQPSPAALLTCSCVMSQANVGKSAFPPQCTGYGHSDACRVLVCLI